MGFTKSGDAARRKEERQRTAQERQAAYDKLTLAEKCQRALERGHARTREYAKLAKLRYLS